MQTLVVGDFETASACDLKKAGAWRYAEDPTTEVLCFGFSTGASEVPFVWTPEDYVKETVVDFELRRLAADPEVAFIAHNVAFEKAIWRAIMVPFFGFPDIPDNRWHDTMSSCAMKVIPLSLDRAAAALRLPIQKDTEGSRLTISLSKPNRKTGMYDRSPETLARVYQYVGQDVLGEWALHNRIGWLSPNERRVWLLDQRINQRGVQLDLNYIKQARKIVADASKPLAQEFRDLTGGLEFTQRDKIIKWLRDDQGYRLPDMKKETLAEILGGDPDDDEDADYSAAEDQRTFDPLPAAARRALEIRQLIGSASVKKLERMEACACMDGRARGLLQYHGAGPGRWAGRIIQPQNFPRGSLKIDEGTTAERALDPDVVVEAILTGDWQYVELICGPAVETVVSGLRHAIIAAPGRVLLAGDFAQVEARVLLALAGQQDKCALLAAGLDPYIDIAAEIYGRPIDKKRDPVERQLGKNSVLGLGFQMGAPKFKDKYGQGQDLGFFKEVVRVYREDWAPEVPKVWYGLEKAAIRTVWDGTPNEAFGVEYRLEDNFLTARLPSGRKLWYYDPQKVRKAMPWDENDVRAGFTYKAQKMGKWMIIDAYGGQLTENVVQGLARDLLVAAMFKSEANNLPICLTVHDEIVAEPLPADADPVMLQQIMEDIPDWAKAIGAPIAAEVWKTPEERYRK